ncbi:hypothetical protein ACHAW5_002778 [Stephanodiscus triporus]|uniref:Peptidase S1 domain-containing protein n=1 Tax=Stephanodiscus triporus TaxID=2934178 RepID=A0ABD3MDJ4_9STRA
MTAPRSPRKRLAKFRRAATAVGCCCCLAAADAVVVPPTSDRRAGGGRTLGRLDDGGGGRRLRPTARRDEHDATGGHQKSNVGDDDERGETASTASPPATDLTPLERSGGDGETAGLSLSIPPDSRYPYMASLQLEGHDPAFMATGGGGAYDVHVCSGFLVAPDLVMTSAHCARYSPAGTDETVQAFNGIEVGRTDLDDDGMALDPYRLDTYHLYYENLVPDELIVHPEFDDGTYEHDVMLVRVFGRSRFPPVRLGRDETDPERATALGWGAESAESGRKFSSALRRADVEAMSNDACRDIVVEVRDPDTGATTDLALRDHVYDDMMCATTTGRHTCYGDAGGPILSEGADHDGDEVHGILSWGYGCVNPDYPAVATRISDHYDWIRDVVCRESSAPPEQYDCPPKMSMMSGGPTRTVTMKLILDAMAVETGFVIETRDTREVVAQRQTGYYKAEGNEVVYETMDLPSDLCYRLILLDSYGDGFCCDMGGGSAIVFLGTDVGHTTGHKLVDVNGNFEFDNSGEFCLTGSSQASDIHDGSSAVLPPSPPSASMHEEEPYYEDQVSSSSWSGPETSNVATSDSQGPETSVSQVTDEEDVEASSEHHTPSSEHYISVQFQFDANPEEISWVLFDLVVNQPKVFVDYGTYPKEEYENKLLTIPITMDGPEMGEKQYVFTVYDKASNGLCCNQGEGYYKVYLGDAEDDHELLGDSVFEFSSSYYFTLFETEDEMEAETADSLDQNATATAELNETTTSAPTLMPSKMPTAHPTAHPTHPPTRSPTRHPTLSPTTARPTDPWEIQRHEDVTAIGALWSIPSKTLPGAFNDVGGDQQKYNLNMDRAIISAASIESFARRSLVAGVVFVFSLVLAIIR